MERGEKQWLNYTAAAPAARAVKIVNPVSNINNYQS